MKMAKQNEVCKGVHSHVYIGTENVPQPHELQSVDVFYCPDCNCTWKEA